jgi:hypothetical protein
MSVRSFAVSSVSPVSSKSEAGRFQVMILVMMSGVLVTGVLVPCEAGVGVALPARFSEIEKRAATSRDRSPEGSFS